jgi:hypothetical protein
MSLDLYESVVSGDVGVHCQGQGSAISIAALHGGLTHSPLQSLKGAYIIYPLYTN